MKTPVHNLKNEWHQREQKDCWLGSGIADKHGYEIYEGDIVRVKDGKFYPIVFAEGMFTLDDAPLKLFAGDVEVVGHIAEEDYRETYDTQI